MKLLENYGLLFLRVDVAVLIEAVVREAEHQRVLKRLEKWKRFNLYDPKSEAEEVQRKACEAKEIPRKARK